MEAEPNPLDLSDHLMQTRQRIIDNIMALREVNEDAARESLRAAHNNMPWMHLKDGVREAMKGQP